jgi:hypothetical protein
MIMYITIEELYSMKEQYFEELRACQAKISVVEDLIKVAEDKEPVKREEDFQAETTEVEVEGTVSTDY